MSCIEIISDFLKTQEPYLNGIWNEFDEKIQKLTNKLSIHDCNEDEEIPIQIIPIQSKAIESNDQEHDFELLGRTFSEQNEILCKRLENYQQTKTINRKIIATLLEELSKYQLNSNEEIEGEVLEYVVKTREMRFQFIERQLNAEVKRLEKAFVEEWKRLSNSRRNFEALDLKLRTIIHPQIVLTFSDNFDKMNELNKKKQEIFKLSQAQKNQEAIDDDLEDEFQELQVEFKNISSDIDNTEKDLKKLKRKIIKTQLKLQREKKEFRNQLIDQLQDKMVFETCNEIYENNLTFNLNLDTKSGYEKVSANDCIIEGLKEEICETVNKIRNAKFKILKLKSDIVHLLDKDDGTTVGYDYMGSNFISILQSKKC
ncbi:CLUMA_CG008064, isoform A [Clunio marinus]|uniref:CLUMA_CG008064, isoform A n=1 Tax=Clunio marinus TaxID=568069 RepID=A0A1J1I2Y6_9DIPT|nr:CLUMA_CG008064, isoform A [Clunio marinus]